MKSEPNLYEVLKEISNHLANSPETGWSIDSPDEIKTVFDEQLDNIEKGNPVDLSSISSQFMPTSSLQDISIDNGWGNEFLKLANRFEKITKRK